MGFKSIASVLILLIFTGAAYAADQGFPGREKFPDIAVIEKQDLLERLSNVIIVDTRSKYEFNTLRIKGAVNFAVAEKTFEQDIENIHKQNPKKDIVFYCNGRTCMKSYIAAKKSIAVGVKNVIAFDAGIFEWVKAYPKEGELLGVSPVNSSQLIASENFHKRLLSPDDFSEKMAALGAESMVLDVRDKYQRAGVGFYPGKERWVSLDKIDQLEKFILKAKQQNKTLLIYDEVGKQVRWVQYSLEKAGLQNYYFMDKGASEYYRQIKQGKIKNL